MPTIPGACRPFPPPPALSLSTRRAHNVAMPDTVSLHCPYCGEAFETAVDLEYGESEYIEDCPVCCRPILLRLRLDPCGGLAGVEAGRDD